MDINKVKAGKYQLLAERWDERTSKPGEPFTFTRHRRGDVVQLGEHDAKRLVQAGAAVEPGALEKADAAAKVRAAQAALALLPDDAREELTASVLGDAAAEQDDQVTALQAELEQLRAQLAGKAADEGTTPPAGTTSELPKPARTAVKQLWSQYAVSKGADPQWASAESTTKDELIARHGA